MEIWCKVTAYDFDLALDDMREPGIAYEEFWYGFVYIASSERYYTSSGGSELNS